MQATLSCGPKGSQHGATKSLNGKQAAEVPTDTAQMSAKQLCNTVLQSTFLYVEAVMGLHITEEFQVWFLAGLPCTHLVALKQTMVHSDDGARTYSTGLYAYRNHIHVTDFNVGCVRDLAWPAYTPESNTYLSTS